MERGQFGELESTRPRRRWSGQSSSPQELRTSRPCRPVGVPVRPVAWPANPQKPIGCASAPSRLAFMADEIRSVGGVSRWHPSVADARARTLASRREHTTVGCEAMLMAQSTAPPGRDTETCSADPVVAASNALNHWWWLSKITGRRSSGPQRPPLEAIAGRRCRIPP